MTRSYDIPSVVGRQIRHLRINRRRTQKAIAQALSIHRSSYTNIENGVRPVTLVELFHLARAFDVPIATLLDGLQVTPPYPSPSPTSP